LQSVTLKPDSAFRIVTLMVNTNSKSTPKREMKQYIE